MATAANTSAEQLRTVQGNDATLAAPAVNLATNTGSPTPAVQYGYCDPSSGSRLASMTYPNGRVLYYDYQYTALDNAIGRVGFIADDDGPGQTEGTPLVKYSYLGLSTVVGEVDANGVTETTTLDDFGRTAEIKYVASGTPGMVTDDFQYGYDYDCNVLYKDNLVNGNLSEVYAYDDLNRLTSYQQGLITAFNSDGTATIAAPAQSQTFGYDALGNQLSVTTVNSTGTTTTTNTFNAQNEMIGQTYDADGNTLTDSSGNHYTYDAWNHEIAVTNSSNAALASYIYDANGNRISQTESGTRTDFYLSAQGQTIEERQGSTVMAQNVWGITYVNDLVQRTEGTSVYYIQHDANYNTTAVTDATGNVVEQYTYTPYGELTVRSADGSIKGDGTIASSTANMPFLFQGGRLDPLTGEDHFGIRELSNGRWMQQDPAGYVDGSDLYQPFGDNPINLEDPTGLSPFLSKTPGAPSSAEQLAFDKDYWARESIRAEAKEQERLSIIRNVVGTENNCGTVRVFAHPPFGLHGFKHLGLDVTLKGGTHYRIELTDANRVTDDIGNPANNPNLWADSPDEYGHGPFYGAGIPLFWLGILPGETAMLRAFGTSFSRAWGVWVAPNSSIVGNSHWANEKQPWNMKQGQFGDVTDASMVVPQDSNENPGDFAQAVVDTAKRIGMSYLNRSIPIGYDVLFNNSNSFVGQVIRTVKGTLTNPGITDGAPGYGHDFGF